MILDDFAYFKHNSTYDEFSTNATLGIDPNTICFVEDTGIIYTHGHQFGGKIEYQGINGVTIDGNTITLDIDYIEDLIPLQNVYTAGDYINISNNKISVKYNDLKDALGISTEGETFTLKPAEANVLGGIKIGYEDNGRNYRVLLDGNNRAFVNVPLSQSETPTQTGVTKDYVDGKVASLTDRLNNIVSEINWIDIFNTYGTQGGPNAGMNADTVKGIIEQWVKSDDGTLIVWQQLTANNAHGKPEWVSVVAEKANQWVTGSQIQQLQDQISLIVGNFDANGDPIAGKWSGIILTAEDENGKSVIDLAADEVIARNSIITPELISTVVNTNGINVGSEQEGYIAIGHTGEDISGNSYPFLRAVDNNGNDLLYVGGHPNRPADLRSSSVGLYSDGSGRLADGKIYWNSEGEVTIDNCTINDTCTFKGLPVVTSTAVTASENDSENYVFLNDDVVDGSTITVIVLTAYVAHPIRVFSNKQMRAYYSNLWYNMNNGEWTTFGGDTGSLAGYISRVDIQKPGVFSFTKYNDLWYVMLDYAD